MSGGGVSGIVYPIDTENKMSWLLDDEPMCLSLFPFVINSYSPVEWPHINDGGSWGQAENWTIRW